MQRGCARWKSWRVTSSSPSSSSVQSSWASGFLSRASPLFWPCVAEPNSSPGVQTSGAWTAASTVSVASLLHANLLCLFRALSAILRRCRPGGLPEHRAARSAKALSSAVVTAEFFSASCRSLRFCRIIFSFFAPRDGTARGRHAMKPELLHSARRSRLRAN